MKKLLFLVLIGCSSFFILQAQPNIQLEEIASGFTKPIDIAHTSDDRLFIVEQRGMIKIINAEKNVLSEPFLDIRNIVSDNANEKGLLGLAFHPKYAENGFFFVNYTRGDNTIVARYSVSEDNPNLANASSEAILMVVQQPFNNHNGGCLKFGADGYLYIGMGDGGAGGDPRGFSQNGNSLLGKILRIDVDNGDPYTIPADNPYVNDPAVMDEIWATGLRNPWRFSFDRLTNDLWIGDVGQDNWEEVSFLAANHEGNANFGWRCREGFANFIPEDCDTNSELIPPVHVYETRGPDGASVTGGFVYRGNQQPSLKGHYIYGDFVSKKIFSITADEAENWINQELLVSDLNISSFGEDASGELYVAAHQGRIYQIMDDQTSPVREASFASQLTISPNPFQQFIQLDATTTLQNLQVQLLDVKGRQVYTKYFRQLHSETLALPSLADGIYILTISNGKENLVRKMVKTQ